MNKDEINRYLHVEIMGKCEDCQQSITSPWQECVPFGSMPDYCSSDSPRRLLYEVVAKIAEPNSYSFYENILFKVIEPEDDGYAYNNGYLTYLMLNATAEQIATACVQAHKAAIQAMEASDG